MVSDDLMANIQRLPLGEKVALLDMLLRAVSEEMRRVSPVPADSDAERLSELPGADGPLPPFAELRGILATNTPPPAECDWKDDYADYLTKKYA